MELTIDEARAKKLLKEVMIELINDRRDLFYELIVEVIEEAGLAAAIRGGRQNEFVDEAEIEAILAGNRGCFIRGQLCQRFKKDTGKTTFAASLGSYSLGQGSQ